MSFITEMDQIGDMKIKNEADLRIVKQPARLRSLSALTIPQTERWIQDSQIEGNLIIHLSNPGANKDDNEVPVVRTRKHAEKAFAYSPQILFDRRKMLLLRLQGKSENIQNLMKNKFNVSSVS